MRLLKKVFLVGIAIFSLHTNAQEEQASMRKEVVVTTFLRGFDDPSKIMESFDLLVDNYQFTSPTDKINSKSEFIKSAKEVAKILTGIEIKKIAVSGDWVSVNYEFKSSIEGLEISIGNEWFRVENGKIQESHLIYDASKWRKVLEQTN